MLDLFRRRRLFKAIATENVTQVEALLTKHPQLATSKRSLAFSRYKHIKRLARNCKNIGKSRFTALELAVETVNANIVKLLLRHGADVNANASPYGALHLAVMKGGPIIVKLLIDYGADLNRAGEKVGSPLHLAVGSKQTEIITLLLGNGADVNIGIPSGSEAGITPLHKAARWLLPDIVALLISHGANVNARSDQKLTPLGEASLSYVGDNDRREKIKQRETMQILEQHGAQRSSKENKLYKSNQKGRSERQCADHTWAKCKCTRCGAEAHKWRQKLYQNTRDYEIELGKYGKTWRDVRDFTPYVCSACGKTEWMSRYNNQSCPVCNGAFGGESFFFCQLCSTRFHERCAGGPNIKCPRCGSR